MKYFLYIVSLLFIANSYPAHCHAQQSFGINVYNNTFFDILAEGYPDKGQGIFVNYFSIIKKNDHRFYNCKQVDVFKGVEGHLKLRAWNSEVPGNIDIYFDNPAVGDLTCTVTAEWPYKVEFMSGPQRGLSPNATIMVTADTANYGPSPIRGVKVTGSSNGTPNMMEPIPPVINFDWEVIQHLKKDADDEQDGKAYKEVKYYFTDSGDYAAVKPDDKSFSLMIYSKKGNTWMFDDTKKVITVMNMPKTVGEGGMMGKEIAENIKKSPLQKDNDEDEFTVNKTGKTKTLLGYTAEEYEMKSNKVITSQMASKTGTVNFWYARVPFDPVKIYTMGVGRPADISKIQNNPKMKNNIFSIPVINKNYLWVETESGGITGMQTTKIQRVNNTIHTSGYKIKVMNSLQDLLKDEDDK